METIRVRNPRNGDFDYEFEVPEHEVLVEGAAVLRASVLASGQACQSFERVYVQDTIYERFFERLVEKAHVVTINHPDPHSGVVGPLISYGQADVIADQLDDAVRRGARILCGGQVEIHGGGGRWVRPAVVVDVDHGMKLMTEETFGPVMPVMKVRTVDEAVALANDGLLTGSVHEAEKDSFKCWEVGGSCIGPAGLTRFLRRKTIIRQTARPATIGMLDETNAPR